MRYKLLGRSGLRVSELCLGTMTFGEDWGWGASKDVSCKIFESFAAAGGNFIDTACNYTNGTSEKFVGEFIHADRDRFVVAGSEVGLVDLDPADVLESGKLGPCEFIVVDVARGRVLRNMDVKREVASRQPYGRWARENLRLLLHLLLGKTGLAKRPLRLNAAVAARATKLWRFTSFNMLLQTRLAVG